MSRPLAAGLIFLTNIFSAHAPVMAEEAPAPALQTSTDYDFPACFDHRGAPATYLPNDIGLDKPWAIYFGARYLDQRNIEDPVIFYDPDHMETLSKAALDFIFAHECFHLASGDAYRAYEAMNTSERPGRDEMQEQEDAADCNAANRMREEFNYTEEEMRGAIESISGVMNIRKRIPSIMACYQTPVVS